MLRKTRAKWLASATALLVVGMAAGFAGLHNRTARHVQPARVAVEPDAAEAGRRAFVRLNCGLCHSLAGAGNPGSPLDGIGARMDRGELRAWSTGSGDARDRLPAGIVRRKAAAADDPELEVLLDYLEQSR